jgi:predicted GNAT superfamily acetyltransferase
MEFTIQDVLIRKAEPADVDAVLQLAQGVVEAGSAAQRANNGFLIPYSRDEYLRFAELADHFYVLVAQGRIAAFVLAHADALTPAFGGEVYAHIRRTRPAPHLVVRQIGVHPGCARRGYGRAIYAHLGAAASRATPPLPTAYCFIWQQPLNDESRHFHAALGWREVETYAMTERPGVVGIWQLDIAPPRA